MMERRTITPQFLTECRDAYYIQQKYQQILQKLDWENKDEHDLGNELYGTHYALQWGGKDWSGEITQQRMDDCFSFEVASRQRIYGKESMESALFLPTMEWLLVEALNHGVGLDLTEKKYGTVQAINLVINITRVPFVDDLIRKAILKNNLEKT